MNPPKTEKRRQKQRIQQAKAKLHATFSSAMACRGEAQWMNGYRCGGKDSDEAHAKEMGWWGSVGKAEARHWNALAAYTRAIRSEKRQ